jgi:CBS domain containing-hemolysin-like protein
MILKKDLLHQMLDGEAPNPIALIREPLVVHESMPILKVLELFKRAPARMVTIIDEYGTLQGIVTQTDLLEAMAGQLPDTEDEEPEIVERQDGSLLIDGMMPVQDALHRLGIGMRSAKGDYHTIAGLAVSKLGHLPQAGEKFDIEGWNFEVVDLDGRRIDKLLATRATVPPQVPQH